MALQEDLFLDPQLRNWVLLPIFAVMILVGLLRHNVTSILASTPRPGDLATIRERRNLQRGAILRQNGCHIPEAAFEAKRRALIDAYASDRYLKDPGSKGKAAPNLMADPAGLEAMMEMLKGNMAMIVPQTALMAWINYFFSGFILLKLPFPLTLRFKQMLQSGVNTKDLDVTWVSSLSWYFLNLFGLQSIYALLLGDDNAAGSLRDVNSMGAGAMPAFGPGQDPSKLFEAESENLEVAGWYSVCHGVEDRMLARYGTAS